MEINTLDFFFGSGWLWYLNYLLLSYLAKMSDLDDFLSLLALPFPDRSYSTPQPLSQPQPRTQSEVEAYCLTLIIPSLDRRTSLLPIHSFIVQPYPIATVTLFTPNNMTTHRQSKPHSNDIPPPRLHGLPPVRLSFEGPFCVVRLPNCTLGPSATKI